MREGGRDREPAPTTTTTTIATPTTTLTLTPPQVRDLKVFNAFDYDRSGGISPSELRNALAKLGCNLTAEESLAMLQK